MPLVHHVLGMDFYLSQNFVPSCIGHLEKFWFTEFAGLPKADTFHYTILKKKIMLVKISTHPLSSEVSGSCQAPGGWYKGSKIPIFTWKLKFYHQQENTASCLPWSDRLASFLFEKMSSEYPSLKSPGVSVSHSLKAKCCAQEEAACSVLNRNDGTKKRNEVFFLRQCSFWGGQRKWLIHMAQGRKEMCAWGSRLKKLIVFAASLRAFWSELVQSLSRVQLLATPWTAAHQAPLSFTVSQSLLTFMSNESVMLFNYLFLCHPLLFCLPSFPASFPVVSSSHQVAKVLELQFSLSELLSTWNGHEGSLLPLLWFLLSHRLRYLPLSAP